LQVWLFATACQAVCEFQPSSISGWPYARECACHFQGLPAPSDLSSKLNEPLRMSPLQRQAGDFAVTGANGNPRRDNPHQQKHHAEN
jgi:hypothetical protein